MFKHELDILMLSALAKLGVVSFKSLFVMFYQNLDKVTAHKMYGFSKRDMI